MRLESLGQLQNPMWLLKEIQCAGLIHLSVESEAGFVNMGIIILGS
jgi:hypothetical protein